MKFIQSYHNEHTKIELGILYELHTLHFAVHDFNYYMLNYYLTSPAYQFEVLPPVEAAIKQLHAAVNNADH